MIPDLKFILPFEPPPGTRLKKAHPPSAHKMITWRVMWAIRDTLKSAAPSKRPERRAKVKITIHRTRIYTAENSRTGATPIVTALRKLNLIHSEDPRWTEIETDQHLITGALPWTEIEITYY